MADIVTKTDWKYDDPVTESDFNRIERNTETINDEVVTHLAEDAIIKHSAKQIGLEDADDLFTATNLEDGMKELFTNVSDGKQLVGTAITDKGGTVPTNPTFQDLADAIGSVSTGKKWASGQAVLSQDKLEFMYVGTGSVNLRYIEVNGLNFKPSNIIVVVNGNARGFSVYTEINDYYDYSPSIKTAPYINGSATGAYIYNIKGDVDNAHSVFGGFRIPVHLLHDEVSDCSWIAYE